ncbi:unnamed protein product [Closterium sp. NIES-53]
MTTLRVLLHVAAQHDYELHSLDFSTAFLQAACTRRFGCTAHLASLDRFLQVPSGASGGQSTVLQRFGFWYSSPQSTPLPTGHSLSAPPSDESIEPSGPYPELVGCLMYLLTCSRPDLAYPLSILARYVVPERHRPEHWEATKRVLRYLCSTSGMGLVLGGQGSVVLTGHASFLAVLSASSYFVATRANTADIFTKALQSGDHQRFCTVLGLLALLFLTSLVTTCSPPLCLWGDAPVVALPCPALPCLSRRPAGRRVALCSPPRRPLQPVRCHLQPVRRPLQPARCPAGRRAALCSPCAALFQPAAPPFAAHEPPLAARAPLFAPARRPAAARPATRSPAGRRPAARIALLCATLLLAPPSCYPPCCTQPCWPVPSCPRRPAAARPAVHRPAGRRPTASAPPCCPRTALLAVAPPYPTLRAPLGRPIQFDTWLDDLQLYLLSDSRDIVSLFDHTSGASLAPPVTADSATHSQ